MSQGLCPSCGAAVNLTAGQTETKCQYCETIVTAQQAEAQFNEVKNSKGGGKLLLAQMSLKSGKCEDALRFFDKVIEEDEKSAEAWFGRGVCFIQMFVGEDKDSRDTSGAVSSLEAAILFSPNPQAMRKRAIEAIVEQIRFATKLGVALNTRAMCQSFLHYNQLLEWALGQVPANNELLKAGIAYLQRAKRDISENEEEDALDPEHSAMLNQNLQNYLTAAEKAGLSSLTHAKPPSLTTSGPKSEASETSTPRPSKGGCFIATACYDDYDHPVVMELRQFRDTCLETSFAGRAFVRWYYAWSPPFANFIGRSTLLKILARVLIVKPAAVIARITGSRKKEK